MCRELKRDTLRFLSSSYKLPDTVGPRLHPYYLICYASLMHMKLMATLVERQTQNAAMHVQPVMGLQLFLRFISCSSLNTLQAAGVANISHGD